MLFLIFIVLFCSCSTTIYRFYEDNEINSKLTCDASQYYCCFKENDGTEFRHKISFWGQEFRIHAISNVDYGNFTVFFDGVQLAEVALNQPEYKFRTQYYSPKFDYKEHELEIVSSVNINLCWVSYSGSLPLPTVSRSPIETPTESPSISPTEIESSEESSLEIESPSMNPTEIESSLESSLDSSLEIESPSMNPTEIESSEESSLDSSLEIESSLENSPDAENLIGILKEKPRNNRNFALLIGIFVFCGVGILLILLVIVILYGKKKKQPVENETCSEIEFKSTQSTQTMKFSEEENSYSYSNNGIDIIYEQQNDEYGEFIFQIPLIVSF